MTLYRAALVSEPFSAALLLPLPGMVACAGKSTGAHDGLWPGSLRAGCCLRSCGECWAGVRSSRRAMAILRAERQTSAGSHSSLPRRLAKRDGDISCLPHLIASSSTRAKCRY